MTLAQIIHDHEGNAGSNRAWRVECAAASWATATLYHYGTPMLTWNVERPDDPDTLATSIGHGSVSDQGGMNIAFKVLGLPYHYDRDARGGGPRITCLESHT